MSIYQKFCKEILDDQGRLEKITLDVPEGFNFGYDVVDAIAEQEPEKRAMVWCDTNGQERIFSFADVKRYSDRMANVFKDAGLSRGMRVMLVLKRHYEYWFAVVALHKLGVVAIPATHMLTVSDYVYRLKMARWTRSCVPPMTMSPSGCWRRWNRRRSAASFGPCKRLSPASGI